MKRSKQNSESKAYQVLLYYCYTQIDDPESFCLHHHQFCIDNNILGRIIVAEEGINGTVSGKVEDCQKYMDFFKSDSRFADLEFKIDQSESHVFQKLYVRTKPEIVNSGLNEINPTVRTGTHLEPSEFKSLKDNPDVVLLDVRSNYEHGLGKFKNAKTLDIDNFREFPEKLSELDDLKDKKVITYCTGGIKCEKASAYLLEQGFESVYQLHGGIIKYGIEEGGEDFDGKCYVFDGRLSVDVNSVNPKTISRCYICDTISDHMVNCSNPHCNNHITLCEDCGWEYKGACSTECMDDPDAREYDGTGYYKKELNGYSLEDALRNKTRKTGPAISKE